MTEFTFKTGETSSISPSYLKKFNIAMAILHFVQSVLIFGLSFFIYEIKNFSVDIYISKLQIKVFTGTKPIFEPVPEVFFAFENVAGILLASFLLMSALAHFLIAPDELQFVSVGPLRRHWRFQCNPSEERQQ